MSTYENTAWLEAAQEGLEQCIANGNYQCALDVIADTKDAGFDREAELMQEVLNNTPVSQFRSEKVYSVDELIEHLEKTGKVPPYQHGL